MFKVIDVHILKYHQ